MKAITIIQARMGSTRLPGKMLLPLNGKPVIQWVFEAAKDITHECWLATTDLREDHLLADWAHDAGLAVHRGSPDNVFARFVAICNHADPDYVVRLCGDCPFVNGKATRALLEHTICAGADYGTYVTADGVPLIQTQSGIAGEAAKVGPLLRCPPDQNTREHVTYHLYADAGRSVWAEWMPSMLEHAALAVDDGTSIRMLREIARTCNARDHWKLQQFVGESPAMLQADITKPYDGPKYQPQTSWL